jgi:hypothetical protein
VAEGVVAPETVLDCGLWNPGSKNADVARWLADEAVAAQAAASSLRAAVTRARRRPSTVTTHRSMPSWCASMRRCPGAISPPPSTCCKSLKGDHLLRVKGIVHVRGEALPRVIQCVHHLRYPDAALPAWPDEARSTRLVFIVRDLSREIVDQAFACFCPAQPACAA